MCGITGIIKNNKISKKDSLDFKKMLSSIKHRGPDSSGFYKNLNFIIGMNRLSIIDIKNGKQPIEDKKSVIIFNGEIYNFNELKNKYLSEQKFLTNTDTEVLLKGYNKFGISFFKKCNGIFAFCIYDKIKKKLIFCRDPLGVKPLYIKYDDDKILFSSELKSFLKLKKNTVNKNGIKQYLASFYTFSPDSSLHKVFSLEPGTTLEIEKNLKTRKTKFFSNEKLIFGNNKSDINIKNELTEAVNRQLISDAPLGLLLSSGLDSMCILSCLKNLGHLKNIETYSAIYDDKKYSEEKLIKKISKKWGFKANFIKINAIDVIKNFDDYIKCYDDLEFMPNSFAMYYLCRHASRTKVLLTGIGGDEIFLGYKTHIASYFKSFIRNRNYFLYILSKLNFMNKYNESFERFLYGSSYNYLESFFLWRKINKLEDIGEKFKSLGKTSFSVVFKNYLKFTKKKFKNFSKKKFFSYVDLNTWLVDHGLKLWDKAGMYSSIEIRVPFLDLKFIKKIFNAKDKYRCKKIGNKLNLIEAFKYDLPKEILDNPKKGFSVPLLLWMKNKKLKKLFIKIVQNDNQLLSDKIKQRFKKDILEVNNNQEAFKIWNIVCLCRWLQINNLKI